MKKKVFLVLFAILVIFGVSQRELLTYGFAQAKGQAMILWQARPVEDFLQKEGYPDSLKQKIRLVQEIRRYAIDSLGLEDSENYTTLYNQKGKPVLWNLSASKEYELKPKEWHFPLLGTFSYKGFFNLEKAKEEQAELDSQGYDTRVRTVGGWSTLGWFKDPILSNMLFRQEGELAELIIHELTHATLYIKDSVNFNENLATFIGEKGAVRFLNFKYGKESLQAKEYGQSQEGQLKLANHMLQGYHVLDSIYTDRWFPGLRPDEKEAIKQNAISRIINNLDTISIPWVSRYKAALLKTRPNNAYFMAFSRYRSQQEILENEFEKRYDRDVKRLIRYYAKNFPSL